MGSKYLNPALRQLKEQQVRYAPRAVRVEQMERAERLLREIEPERQYRYPELFERITSHRTEVYPDLIVTGDEALNDLRQFVEDLSVSIPLAREHAGEDVLTVDDVSERFNVSTKTVQRWRRRGLPSRKFLIEGRQRVGFLRSSLDWFVACHADDVERGARFSQLDDRERERMIRRARRLFRHGANQTEITKRLARRFGRSHETVRYTLKNFDRLHPEVAVFPDAPAPLNDVQKDELYQLFLRGTAVEELARRFRRTKPAIYRIVGEVRARNLINQTIDYIPSDEFSRPDADSICLGPLPIASKPAAPAKAPPGLPPYLASLYATPLLSREEEAHYFRKLNYLKHVAKQLREKLDPAQPRVKDMETIESLLEQASDVKNFLIRANLRLVVSVAKKHMKPNANFFEMISDGNMSLIRAIEKFDYSRGFKFSTYATWAIMKNFARSIPQEHTLNDRFRTGNDELFINSTDPRTDQFRDELTNSRQHEAIMGILGQLDLREREIITARFGLQPGAAPQTLEQVGSRLGVTKERIRQLETRALKKLRKIAETERLDVPGL